ncbi:MAG TPA: cytochrome c oxidase subunit II [Gemmatimonadaceae bacterium]|nr:cytochrome c oxidase subunit II [Gemmatimonadaceae bacterium]
MMQGKFRIDALDPAGPNAERISDLFWSMTITASVIYLIVIAMLLYAAFRRRTPLRGPAVEARMERRAGVSVAVGLGVTVVVLLVTLIVDFGLARTNVTTEQEQRPVTIEIVGHQWWWEIHYEDSIAQRRVTTANELYLPVGERVKLTMTSTDVIHSLWIPNLAGKRDLVPGYRTETWIRADRAGVYRGQCAEFCGHQHAKMGLTVIAVPREQFDQWITRQLQPATTPSDSLALAGQEVFVDGSCAMCHNITGTRASGVVGPDLTHLATRRMIGAGTLLNRRGQLAGWIVDPQGIKPGVRMPSNQLEPNDLRALLAYLESLR